MLIVVTPAMAIASVTICFQFIGVASSRILEQVVGTALQFNERTALSRPQKSLMLT
jgi:hypothetical protein